MSEHDENQNPTNTDEQNTDNQGATSGEELTKDQRRIMEWQEAVEQTPRDEDMEGLRTAITEAAEMLETAKYDYRKAVAMRGRVYGWHTIAEQEGITPKMIHNWRRETIDGWSDLSSVPDKEMKREQERIERAQERLAEEARLREQVEAQRARLEAARKGLNR